MAKINAPISARIAFSSMNSSAVSFGNYNARAEQNFPISAKTPGISFAIFVQWIVISRAIFFLSFPKFFHISHICFAISLLNASLNPSSPCTIASIHSDLSSRSQSPQLISQSSPLTQKSFPTSSHSPNLLNQTWMISYTCIYKCRVSETILHRMNPKTMMKNSASGRPLKNSRLSLDEATNHSLIESIVHHYHPPLVTVLGIWRELDPHPSVAWTVSSREDLLLISSPCHQPYMIVAVIKPVSCMLRIEITRQLSSQATEKCSLVFAWTKSEGISSLSICGKSESTGHRCDVR